MVGIRGEGMRVICTGISGTERVGFLEEVASAGGPGRPRPRSIFDVSEAMFQIAQDVGEPVEEETILDMFPHALVLLRAAALEKISSVCEQADQYARTGSSTPTPCFAGRTP